MKEKCYFCIVIVPFVRKMMPTEAKLKRITYGRT